MIRWDQRWDFWTALAFGGTGPEGRVFHRLSGTRAPIQDQRERAAKDQLADVARLLAINIGWYQHRYGDVPQETLLKMVRAEALDDETLALLSSGMESLVSALVEVTGLRDDLEDASRH
jgi:hypothetical protein